MNTPFIFFGTSKFSVIFCEELKNKYSILPSLIVTTPDRPAGRKQILTPSPMKLWADANNIKTLQPEKLKDEVFLEEIKNYPLFIVASYGKIIPQVVLDLPKLGTLNIHPSLLPKYRGASPIQNQILNNEEKVGTTIMLMDAQMDHGDIVVQKVVNFARGEFPNTYTYVEERLALESAALFAKMIDRWVQGQLQTRAQLHDEATFTQIITKEEAEIDLGGDDLKNYLKYLAFFEWPRTFFFTETSEGKKRNIITDAEFVNGRFIIKKIIPEGKKETIYQPNL